MGRMPAVLALGTGLGYLQLVLQESVPRVLLARRWHAMLGLHPSSPIASVGLAGEWKKWTRAAGHGGTAGRRLLRRSLPPHRRRASPYGEKKAHGNQKRSEAFQRCAAVAAWRCWEPSPQVGLAADGEYKGPIGAVAPWLRPPKRFCGPSQREGKLRGKRRAAGGVS